MARKVTPVEINGKTVLIEVDAEGVDLVGVEIEDSAVDQNSPRDGYEQVSTQSAIDKLKKEVADMSEVIESVVSGVDKGISAAKPDEWSVEFSLGYALEGGIKIPFVSGSGKAEGGIKITAKWKSEKNTQPLSANGD